MACGGPKTNRCEAFMTRKFGVWKDRSSFNYVYDLVDFVAFYKNPYFYFVGGRDRLIGSTALIMIYDWGWK